METAEQLRPESSVNYFLPKKKKSKGLKRVSSKQSARNKEYTNLRRIFLKDLPFCAICNQPATDIHHKEGRGSKTNDTATWLQTCRQCHINIHYHPSWAREQGYLL